MENNNLLLSGFNRHASNDPELSGTSCCNIWCCRVRRIFAIEAVNFPDSVKTNLFVLVRMWSILIDFQRHFLYNRIINIIRLRRSMYMKKKTLAFWYVPSLLDRPVRRVFLCGIVMSLRELLLNCIGRVYGQRLPKGWRSITLEKW